MVIFNGVLFMDYEQNMVIFYFVQKWEHEHLYKTGFLNIKRSTVHVL